MQKSTEKSKNFPTSKMLLLCLSLVSFTVVLRLAEGKSRQKLPIGATEAKIEKPGHNVQLEIARTPERLRKRTYE